MGILFVSCKAHTWSLDGFAHLMPLTVFSLRVLIAASVQLDMSLDETKAAPQEAGPHGEASAAAGGENSAPAVPAEPGSCAQQAAAAEDAEVLKQHAAADVVSAVGSFAVLCTLPGLHGSVSVSVASAATTAGTHPSVHISMVLQGQPYTCVALSPGRLLRSVRMSGCVTADCGGDGLREVEEAGGRGVAPLQGAAGGAA